MTSYSLICVKVTLWGVRKPKNLSAFAVCIYFLCTFVLCVYGMQAD